MLTGMSLERNPNAAMASMIATEKIEYEVIRTKALCNATAKGKT